MTRVPAELRRSVRERAGERCEYRLALERLSFQSHQMEHIVAQKHGGATDAGNLALSCIGCNQCKGADLSSLDPLTGALTPLFHPRRERWRDHFELRGLSSCRRRRWAGSRYVCCNFNAPERVTEREWFAAAGELVEPQG